MSGEITFVCWRKDNEIVGEDGTQEVGWVVEGEIMCVSWWGDAGQSGVK